MWMKPGMTMGAEASGRHGLAIAGVLLLLLAGCAPEPKTPVPVLKYHTNGKERQPNLLVLLRGLGADNAIFAEEGVIDEIRRRHLPFDVVAPDTHYGYYRSHTLETRLKQDVIDPARHEGYRQIWLAGFSLGGMGSLLYLRAYPHDIDGVLLASPFLGAGSLLDEIHDAGGVAAWNPASGDKNDMDLKVWDWIKHHDFNVAPPVWLGYGRDDSIVSEGAGMLADALPRGNSFTVPGNHSVATLKTIFLRQLDMLAARNGVAAGKVSAAGCRADCGAAVHVQ